MPVDEPGHELLLTELGRINSELAAQRRVSAMTVHDLGNPAQVIMGLSELLLDHPTLDPFVRTRVEQLHRSALTMAALVSDLNHGFSLEDQHRLDLQRIDLVELVTSVVERQRVLANAKDMTLMLLVDQPRDAGCWVDGDPVKLERALGNLLGNAIKFSPPRSTVSVALDRGIDNAKIAVHDEGPGISPTGLQRIFEVFHREQSTAHVPGLGLGLFITKQIAESHGGTVDARSEPGHGSTFLLEVPLAVGAYADLA